MSNLGDRCREIHYTNQCFKQLIIKRILKYSEEQLSVVAHSCNPLYLGGRDWKDCGSRAGQAKSY
jgi:hypothetical protein